MSPKLSTAMSLATWSKAGLRQWRFQSKAEMRYRERVPTNLVSRFSHLISSCGLASEASDRQGLFSVINNLMNVHHWRSNRDMN